MFVNKVPFFITLSREIKFGTVKSLPNCQIAIFKNCLRKVIKLYRHRGLIVSSVLADIEFESLRPWFPLVNTAAANEHVPDIERYICTVKEQTRSTYTMLPCRHLPRIALIHLVKNVVFWLNAFPTDNGVSKKCSLQYIMMGQHLSYSKHAVIEFGVYVQTHEEIHYRWTKLPIPREAIKRVSSIGQRQGMPSLITYAYRHGREIGDMVADYPEDNQEDDDDEKYEDSNQSDEELDEYDES
jgi:hypothetical protein